MSRTSPRILRTVLTAVATALPLVLVPLSTSAVHAAAVPPTLKVTGTSQLYVAGDVAVAVESSAASVGWSLSDPQGLPVRSGNLTPAAGRATLDLDDLAPGYYGLDLQAGDASVPVVAHGSIGVVTPLPESRRGSSIGVGTHVFASYKPAQFDAFALVGYGSARLDASWPLIEKTRGVYDFPGYLDGAVQAIIAAGASPQLIANYSNPLYDNGLTPSTPEGLGALAEFATALVDHYGPEVALGVWNEYTGNSTSACGNSAACYAEMISVVADRVRQDHPDTPIIAAANSAPGGALPDLDAVSSHAYGYPEPPETFLAAKIASVRASLDGSVGGSGMPIWLDEVGYPTHTGGGTSEAQQADYLVRSEVIALASGVAKLDWYDLVNDGYDAGSREQQFGVMRLPTAGFAGLTPKPALVTQAVTIRQIANATFDGQDDLGAATYSYRFRDGGALTRVLWATTPTSVELRTSRPVTVTDRFGAETILQPQAGVVRVSIGEHPVFLNGSVRSIAAAAAPVSVVLPAAVAIGEPVAASVSVDCSVAARCRGVGPSTTVTLQGQSVTVPVHPGTVSTVPVQLTAPTREGAYEVIATATACGRQQSYLSASTVAEPAFTASVVPTVTGTDPLTGTVDVEVVNNTNAAVDVADIGWSARGTEVDASGPSSIPAHDGAVFTADLGPVQPWVDYAWTVTADFGARTETFTGSTGFGPVNAAEAPELPPIELASDAKFTYGSRSWGGPDDLSGTVRPSWTADALVLDAVIVDNVFHQPNFDSNLWRSDSIQFAVSDGVPGTNPRESMEIGVGLIEGSPVVYSFPPLNFGEKGVTPGATATIVRDGTSTTYHVEVPWTSLALTGVPQDRFGLSVVVNDDDNDGLGRAGFAEWGSGITGTKLSSLFRPVQIIPGS